MMTVLKYIDFIQHEF